MRGMRSIRATPWGAMALALGWALGCGDAVEERPGAAAGAPGAVEAAPRGEQVAGDPLLSRAREAIRDGALPEDVRDEVLRSTAPEHARARRVLLAMAEPTGAAVDEADDGESASAEGDDERSRPPPILPPADPSAAIPDPDPAPPRSGGSRPSSNATDRPLRRPRGEASLGKLALRTTQQGATLTIAAPSSLVVGVANQPSSGLVRLVIESAQAGRAVLHARPKVDGAEVTGVRQGEGTVQITIRLDPGWTLGSVQPFSGGAKVHLRARP